MVDITAKHPSVREAVARGKVLMRPETARAIANSEVKKGDVFATAQQDRGNHGRKKDERPDTPLPSLGAHGCRCAIFE